MTRATSIGQHSWRAFGPPIVFLVVTLYMMYPVSLWLADAIIGRPFEDAFESIWYLYWYKHALFDLRVSPLFQPDIFFPGGWDLRFTILPPLYPLLFSPLTAVVGPVAAYNLLLIGSCVFAAYGAYRLGRSVGGNVPGGLLAGVAYAFYPNREVYLGGHLNFLLGSMWLPWLLYCLVRAGQSASHRTRWMALAGVGLGMSIGGAWQFVFISTVAGAVFAVVYLWPKVRREWKSWLRPVGMAVGVAVLVAGPLLLNASAVRGRMGESAEFSFENVNRTSVSVERLFVPSALNPLFWDLARKTFPLWNGGDSVVNPGYVTILLAAVGVLGARPVKRESWGLLGVLALGVILMLGPTLHVWGQPVTVRLPDAGLAQSLPVELRSPDGSMRIPLPALVLYWVLPAFRSFHGFSRWGAMLSIGLAAMAALGLTHLAKRLNPRWRIWLGVGCSALLLIELNMQPLSVVTTTQQMDREVDRWLAAQPERSVIIEYPLDYTMRGQSLYYTIAHGQKIVHGTGSVLPESYSGLLAILAQWPGDVTLDRLQAIGVRYILVHAFVGDDFENATLPQLLAIPRLTLVNRFPTRIGPVREIYVFELEPPGRSDD